MGTGTQAGKDSSAQSTNDAPKPPAPLIAPTGDGTWDTLAGDINQAAAPFQDLSSADASGLDKANDVIGGIMGAIMTPLILLNDGFALLTAPIAKLFPPLPAATLGMLHLGIPHEHDHPPAFPIPLPSFGPVALAGSASVLINGLPAARAGDIGIAITCGTFAPPFEVFTGSSKVFIGGARAARMLDITRHCQPGGGWSALAKLAEAGLGLLGVGTEVLGAVTQASDAKKDRDKAAKEADKAKAAAEKAKAAKAKVDAAKAALEQAASAPSDDGGGSSGSSSTPGSIEEMDAQADAADAQMDADDAKAQAAADARAQAIADAEADLEEAEQEEQDAEQDEADAEEQEEEYDDAADAADASAKTSAIQAGLDAAAMALGLLMGLDPGLPPCFGLLLSGMPNVLIGGFPMPPWGDVAHGIKKLAKLKSKRIKVEKSAHGPNEKCDRPGHPVDPVTGANEEEIVDYEEPGPSPFVWGRNYRSSDAGRDGPMGRGFRHTHEHELSVDLDRIVYTDPEGRTVETPPVRPGQPAYVRGYTIEARDEGDTLVHEVSRKGRPTLRFVRARGSTSPPRLVRERAPGLQRERIFDARGRLTGMLETSARGEIETRLGLDDAGHVLEVRRGPRGARELPVVAAYGYDRAGCLVTFQDALGARATYAYDAGLRLARATNRNGYAFHFRYDDEGRCVDARGEDGLWAVSLRYEPAEQRTIVTGPGEGVWTYEYDDTGAIVAIEDPLGGRRTRVIVDGVLDREVLPGGQTLEALYDGAGAQVGLVDDLGHLYPPRDEDPAPPDPLALRVPATAFGRAWGSTLDGLPAQGRPSSYLPEAIPWPEPAPAGSPALRRDALGRVVEELDAEGRRRAWAYDAAGNVVRYTDREGRAAQVDITSWNLAGAETDPLGNRTSFAYTPYAKIARVVDPGGAESVYERDPKGRIARVVRHGATRETYLHDAAHRLIEKRDATGALLLRRSIGENGLPSMRRLASGEVYRYAYDAAGHVIRASGRETEVERAFDAAGQLLRDVKGGRGVEHQFERGILRRTTVFGRFSVTYRREPDGSLVLDTPCGGTHRIQRCTHGGVLVTFGNGTRTLSSHDPEGRCLGRAVWRAKGDETALWSVRYTYSPEGDLLRIDDSARGVTEYAYDAAHRLVGETGPDGKAVRFVLDAAGNVVDKPGLSRAELLEGNRLARAGSERFRYDARNHLAEHGPADDALTRYGYDSLDMLVSVAWSGRQETWKAGYDGLRRRAYKVVGSARTEFYWDGDRLAAEVGPTGAVRVYVYPGPSSLVPLMFIDYDGEGADPASGRAYYVFGNQIGVPLHIENQAGEVVWLAERVDPYGAVTVKPGAKIAYAPRFPGHYLDEETGLHDNRHRSYSPRLGRYLQSDPVGQSGGVNLYAYPAAPLTRVDVLGLMPSCSSSEEHPVDANALDEEHPESIHEAPEHPPARPEEAPVQKIPIGEHFYLFTSGTGPHDHAPHLIISSHGGFWEKAVGQRKPGAHFTVPEDTTVHFYVDHGTVLKDPGFEEVLGMRPKESRGPGEEAVNYELSKFQTKKGESYEGISSKIAQSQVKIDEQKALLHDQGVHLDDPAHQADAEARLDARAKELKDAYDEKIAALKSAPKDSPEAKQLVKDLGQLDKDRAALAAARGNRQYEGYDVLTVRNRPFKGGVTVNDAIKELGDRGYNYQNIHGNFCRSPIRYPWQRDPPSADAVPEPRWGRPPGFVRNPPVGPSTSASGGSGGA